jgi:hypothetical protein
MIAGTKAESVIAVIEQIPLKNQVFEITLDMAANMGLIAKNLMPLVSQIGSMYKSLGSFTRNQNKIPLASY